MHASSVMVGSDRRDERKIVRDWIGALDDLIAQNGGAAAERVLANVHRRAAIRGVSIPFALSTPYVNSIPPEEQQTRDGDPEMEERIENLVRWNALAMVVRANQRSEGIGGHIATFASAATLFAVGFNYFFRPEDKIYFQGHASPGVYARAFLEGRLTEEQLANFRRELSGGVPSYPHPHSMPNFWEIPTVSMGLSPLMAIYQARFDRYLEHRNLLQKTGRVWAFAGDGEMDEPESIGAIELASRESLSNLILVVNCNLQRLDGPVRGNGKIIQELESLFVGAGWRVIKVIWGREWDPLLERDLDGLLVQRMEEAIDGEYQKYVVAGGAYMREHFFGRSSELLRMVEHLSDREIDGLRRGGHDPDKVYAAYAAAVDEKERPIVILAKTIKGYGLGSAGEALNITHQAKSMDVVALRAFRDRFAIPLSDDALSSAPFLPAPPDLLAYLLDRRERLGGPRPARRVRASLPRPDPSAFESLYEGTDERPATTTMLLVRLMTTLLKDEKIGKLIVPIIPDEARTFGAETLFSRIGIYSPRGQLYDPVDSHTLTAYRESQTGQLLEEGITEAGALASAIAAGTSHVSNGVHTVPFFLFYSMFGFQRVGDLLWAAGDARARGFLIGGTSGRTTLNGEGLQHQDGHSQLIAMTNPAVRAYDPAFGYEIAAIVEHGLERFASGDDALYYLTVANVGYGHPRLPEAAGDGIIRGIHPISRAREEDRGKLVRIIASGPIVIEALAAKEVLQAFGVGADVYSVTSWKALYADALDTERRNRLRGEANLPFVARMLGDNGAPIVAASDFMKALPLVLARFLPGKLTALGTDGFGLSETREALRDYFEVSAKHIAFAALRALEHEQKLTRAAVERARTTLGIDPDKRAPEVCQ